MPLPFLNGLYPSQNASFFQTESFLPWILFCLNQKISFPECIFVWTKKFPSLNASWNMFEWTKNFTPKVPQKICLNKGKFFSPWMLQGIWSSKPKISLPECLKQSVCPNKNLSPWMPLEISCSKTKVSLPKCHEKFVCVDQKFLFLNAWNFKFLLTICFVKS